MNQNGTDRRTAPLRNAATDREDRIKIFRSIDIVNSQTDVCGRDLIQCESVIITIKLAEKVFCFSQSDRLINRSIDGSIDLFFNQFPIFRCPFMFLFGLLLSHINV